MFAFKRINPEIKKCIQKVALNEPLQLLVSNELRYRCFSSSTGSSRSRSSSQANPKGGTHENNEPRPTVCWLDLNGYGLSAIERLCLEEALLRHDPLNRSWAIVGTHDPIYNTRLNLKKQYHEQYSNLNDNNGKRNEDCIVIMGIGGKPEKLLNIDKIKDDGVIVIKRFSGGGTVVVDHSSLWTTFIGRTKDIKTVKPYPKDIMKWSADEIFHNVFKRLEASYYDRIDQHGTMKRTLMMDTKSCGLAASFFTSKTKMPAASNFSHSHSSPNDNDRSKFQFELRENDYVLGDYKMGGNAQSITSGSWLHHTSFLWDYENENMEYLQIPEKRPSYRGDRNHDNFLVKLKSVYGEAYSDVEGKRIFFSHVKEASKDAFTLQEVSFNEAMQLVNDELGGFQNWFEGKCRTNIIEVK